MAPRPWRTGSESSGGEPEPPPRRSWHGLDRLCGFRHIVRRRSPHRPTPPPPPQPQPQPQPLQRHHHRSAAPTAPRRCQTRTSLPARPSRHSIDYPGHVWGWPRGDDDDDPEPTPQPDSCRADETEVRSAPLPCALSFSSRGSPLSSRTHSSSDCSSQSPARQTVCSARLMRVLDRVESTYKLRLLPLPLPLLPLPLPRSPSSRLGMARPHPEPHPHPSDDSQRN